MTTLVKFIIKAILMRYFALLNKVRITNGSIVSYKVIRESYRSKFLNGVTCYGNVKVGNFTSINGPSTKIVAQINKIEIGSFCSIAGGVQIQEYYHDYTRLSSYFIHQNIFNKGIQKDIFSKGDIKISDDVWIGANSVILSGVSIGRGCVIGAGSIVTKDVPAYSIVAGNPAKLIKKRFDEDTIKTIEASKWWTWDIQKLQENEALFMGLINVTSLRKASNA